jgi:hypothetical protein
VPAGSNIRLLVDGIIVAGTADWQGKIGDISGSPGENTDAGDGI